MKWTIVVTQSFRTFCTGDVSNSRLAKTKMAKSVYDAGWATFRLSAQPPADESGVARGR
jgi:hypothetical protein